jgi:Histidine kinase-, DNA gyrase B-, and HSP90-like ATPase
MARYPVQVKKDHIEALVATKKPIHAIAELIWNSFDADATKVSVRFEYNALSALERVRVQDNGAGIDFQEAVQLFGNLGGSWKNEKRRTASGRNLHGKSGKGRFRAFSLGSLIEWHTRSLLNGSFADYTITASADDLESFEISDLRTAHNSHTGTEVVISNIQKNFVSLFADDAPKAVAQHFAVYLSEYPGLTIDYDGVIVDPRVAQHHQATYPLGEIELSDGQRASADLTIIEWNEPQERALHLCDAHGISLDSVSPGIQAPGFNFTAYIKSDYLRELDKEGRLMLEELDPDVARFIQAAKAKMKQHFRVREAEKTQALVQQWKEQRIYPYEGDPSDPLEIAERQVFDVVAVNLHAYLEDFEDASQTNKRFTFSLVKQALKENPESLQLIFEDVVKLPKERQDDLAELLKKTSLTAIISSAKIVADRLNFLRGLEILLFDKDSKEQLLERDQLHKILAKETWMFGENFHLTNNEDSLEEVLNKYLDRLGKRSDDEDQVAPVEREGGKRGRVDLMLARTVPQPRPDEWEHLVIELKRPSKKVDLEVLAQVKSYAMAVAKDERFRHTKTRWVFWAISNKMTEEAIAEANQADRAAGIAYADPNQTIVVWAKTWGQLIQDCKGRLNFFKKHLNYEADRDSAKNYLQRTHEKYLPSSVGIEPDKSSNGNRLIPDSEQP